MRPTRISASWSRPRVTLLAASAVAIALGASPAYAGAESASFVTPGLQTFKVPANVDQITISATGAQGGVGGASSPVCKPGAGGQLQATFAVTPGATLSVAVGGEGATAAATLTGGLGGFGGGGTGGTGTGGYGGGGGGGATTIAYSGGAPLLVAAGGGGCGAFQHEGEAGGNDGAAGGNGAISAKGGAAGGSTAGGVGGLSANLADALGEAGSAGQGGNGAGAATQNGGGGGGGGGYFGGGGGGGVRGGEATAGGGGGGSDFFGTGAFSYSSKPGTGTGTGQVTLTYTGGQVPAAPTGPAGPAGPTGLVGPAGAQGPAGPAGADGKIELVTCATVTKTVKSHGKKKKVQSKQCTSKVVTGVVKFTASAASATLSRAGRLYAAGSASGLDGVERLALSTHHGVPSGRYTLTLSDRSGRPLSHTTVTIA